MFDFYEDLSEWVRWVLFIPVYLLALVALAFLFKLVGGVVGGFSLYDSVAAPLVGGALTVVVGAFLIPKGKLFLCYFFNAVFLLGIVGAFILPEGATGHMGVTQSICSALGGLAGTGYVRAAWWS